MRNSKLYEHAQKADLCLALGSSLTVSPACDMPKIVGKKEHGNLVICNLQKTPLEKIATLNIHARCDVLMQIVCKKLGVEIPKWTLKRKFIVGHKHLPQSRFELYVKGIDHNEEHLPASIFKAVEVNIPGVGTKILEEEPFIIRGTYSDRSMKLEVKLRLHFMRHYNEPSLDITVPVQLGQENATYESKYLLVYHPDREEWEIFSGDDMKSK